MHQRDLWVFLHVHKTAGMTFLANLFQNLTEGESLPVYARPMGLHLTPEMTDQGWDARRVDE